MNHSDAAIQRQDLLNEIVIIPFKIKNYILSFPPI